MSESESITRRTLGRRAVQAGSATVMAQPFLNAAAADTASGNVELQTTATVPTNTTLEITVYEDTDGSGSANNQSTVTVGDGTNTYELSTLQSTTNQSDVLWIELSLSTSDSAVTPSLDSATLTLPAESSTATGTDTSGTPIEPDEPQGLFELLDNTSVFVALTVGVYAIIGMWSRSLTFGAWAGAVAFYAIAFRVGIQIYQQIALLTLVLVFLGMAFKLVAFEFEVSD